MSTVRTYPKRIENCIDLVEAIAFMQAQQGSALFRVPPLQALYEGRIAFLDVAPLSTPAKMVKAFLAIADKPALVIVGDDGELPVGPEGVPQLARLVRWARQIILHGAGGEVWHYDTAVRTTEAVGRVVLIECPSHLVEDYREFSRRHAPRVSGFLIQPPPGEFHPSIGGNVTDRRPSC